MQILRELLFHPQAAFGDLNISGLSSDHFSYHIKTLLKLELVKKNKAGKYSLTTKGKEYANTMDTDKLNIEKQPKVAVLVIPQRIENNKPYIVVQTRLKQPYYGFKGFITGKVRFGEKILEAATRELVEEAGLNGEMQLRYIIHELVYNPEQKLLEDKIFHVVLATNCTGKLITEFDGGKNEWVTHEVWNQMEDKFYDEQMLFELAYAPPQEFYIEREFVVEGF